MSAFRVKPTSACALHMSAIDPKRTRNLGAVYRADLLDAALFARKRQKIVSAMSAFGTKQTSPSAPHFSTQSGHQACSLPGGKIVGFWHLSRQLRRLTYSLRAC